MRTTVTLDSDTYQRIRDRAHGNGTAFKAEINRVLRAGLEALTDEPAEPYRTEGVPLGVKPGLDMNKALQIVAELDDADQARRVSGRS